MQLKLLQYLITKLMIVIVMIIDLYLETTNYRIELECRKNICFSLFLCIKLFILLLRQIFLCQSNNNKDVTCNYGIFLLQYILVKQLNSSTSYKRITQKEFENILRFDGKIKLVGK